MFYTLKMAPFNARFKASTTKFGDKRQKTGHKPRKKDKTAENLHPRRLDSGVNRPNWGA